MHLAHAIAIIITSPLMLPVIDSCVGWFHAVIAPVLVRIDDCSFSGNSLGNDPLAGVASGVADDPTPLFPSLATDDVNDGWPIIGHRSMAGPLIGSRSG